MSALLSPKVWLALLVAILAGLWLWERGEAADARTELVQVQGQRDAAKDALKAEQTERQKEHQRAEALERVVSDAQAEMDQARADAGAAGDARDRLQQRVDALVAAARRAGPNPQPAIGGQGEPGGDPIGVLAGVFSRVDATAGQLAAHADQLRAAGLACERAYDSLK